MHASERPCFHYCLETTRVCVVFTLIVFHSPFGRCYTNGARNQGLGPVVLNPIWETESPESFQNHYLCLVSTLDLELGRAGSAGTFQSLLPPGGAMSNSLARHQHLCEQAYSAPRVLRMPRGGGRERGWDLGDPGGLHPSLPASCFPGCLCAALSVAERNHGPRRQQTEGRRPCFGFPDLTLGRPVCLPVWSWEFCGVYGHGYGCQYSWHLGLNGSLLRDQPAPLP